MSEKITIDILARMSQNEFATIHGKLAEHDKRFDTLESKVDNVEELGRKVLSALDENTTILRRLDEERLMTNSWLKRIDEDVEQIKEKVGMTG